MTESDSKHLGKQSASTICFDPRQWREAVEKNDSQLIESMQEHAARCVRCEKVILECNRLNPLCLPEDLTVTQIKEALPEDLTPAVQMPDFSIDGFQNLRFHDKGGMGRVFRAEQLSPKRTVAIKVVNRERISSTSLSRFEREARAMATLNHACVATLFDTTRTSKGDLALILEYVDGTNLRKYCEDHTLTVTDRVRLFRKVCLGVAHLHQSKPVLLHRDLKPGNILVTETNDGPLPKIIDFGLAKLIDDNREATALTDEFYAIGTIHYMSPEQADAKRTLGPAADVYSLGIVLYEILCGKLPWAGTSRKEIMENIHETPVPAPSWNFALASGFDLSGAGYGNVSPRKIREWLSGDLDQIVLKAVEKTPEDRYRDAAEFAEDLQNFLSGKKLIARNPGPWKRAKKFYRHHRALTLSSLTVLLTLLVATCGLAFAYAQVSKAETIEREARKSLEKSEGELRTALQQAAESNRSLEATSELLVSILQEIDPLAVESGDGALREELVRKIRDGIKQLDEHVTGNAEAVLQWRTALADAMVSLSSETESLDIWRGIIEDVGQLKGKDSRDYILAKVNFGVVLLKARQGQAAADTLLEAQSLTQSYFPEDDELIISIASYIAETQRFGGHYKEAIEINLEALRRIERLESFPEHVRASIHNSLGLLYRNQKDHSRAAEHFEKALEFLQSVRAPDHASLIPIKGNLVLTYGNLGDYPRAVDRQEDLVREAERIYPSDSDQMLTCRLNLATLYPKVNRFEDSAKLLNQIGAIESNPRFSTHAKIELQALRALHLGESKEAISDLRALRDECDRQFGEADFLTQLCDKFLSQFSDKY